MSNEIIYKTKDGARVRRLWSADGSGRTANRLPIQMPLGQVLVQRIKDGHFFYAHPETLVEEK